VKLVVLYDDSLSLKERREDGSLEVGFERKFSEGERERPKGGWYDDGRLVGCSARLRRRPDSRWESRWEEGRRGGTEGGRKKTVEEGERGKEGFEGKRWMLKEREGEGRE